ncbi:hypothetical protein PENANT_c067G03210 [Penicillium antarcticum]|uniref:Uncharacterized protein n=1 Tax=Penicillium antarcticum TaxID=416450 RepID=A0A1V6PPZ2_9EURO|nr:hypothetical protein PENANT_c067G03210 [Penicillium antarcticum]
MGDPHYPRSHLTSFDAWQLDRYRDELMFQSGSWRTSPTFVGEQATPRTVKDVRRQASSINKLQEENPSRADEAFEQIVKGAY